MVCPEVQFWVYLSTSYPQNVENLRKLKWVDKVVHMGSSLLNKKNGKEVHF